jgi:antitoxin PrlF
MMLATLTSKARITLPKDIRTLLQLEPGDKVAFIAQSNGDITVTKASAVSFAALRGLLPQPKRSYSVEEMNQAVQDAVADRALAPKPKVGKKHARA